MITQPSNHLRQIPELNLPLTALKGIGPKKAGLLARKGLHTLSDLLFFEPIRYEDRSRVLSILKTCEGEAALVKGKVVSFGEERFFRSGKRLFRIMIEDETAFLELLWFHYKKVHLRRFTREGAELMAYGRIRRKQEMRQMIHPDITLVDPLERNEILGFYPVYPAISGISGHHLRFFLRQALDKYQGSLLDAIPGEIICRYALPGLAAAVRGVHIPPQGSSIDLLNRLKTKNHQRLTFDRFFRIMLNIFFRRKFREKRDGQIFQVPKDLIRRVEKYFPFTLTGDQVRAIDEILEDLNSGRAMNRLLEGDVGCGKTVVAAVAAYVTVSNRRQVAVMVPTQILAQQHHEYFSTLAKSMGFRSVLLTGSIKKSDRLGVYEKVRNGAYNLIIGTQALIQEGLSFSSLGLVVIDEQHRFGVRQRALLDSKGTNPHLLVMTATPIPRTLAMTVYADLNISVINEFPEGHTPVETRLVSEQDKRYVYNTLREKMTGGEQGMVLCPVIEASEETDLKTAVDMHEKLKKILAPRFRVGLIHGRMPTDEKHRVMNRFRKGHIDLLVCTTVIEVGVHVPGATIMVVEHPERFGMAQLHQLRGRVGRGSKGGLCFLMLSRGLSDESLQRLKILAESHNGFEIAQKDLEMRGQGELIGFRQAGAGELDFREMFREPELLTAAKREAELVIDRDPELSRPENHKLRIMLEMQSARPLDL